MPIAIARTTVHTMPAARLAYMGEAGAFGEAACALADAGAVAVPCVNAADAIAAVRAGDCAAAVLPVHSSVAGPVDAVLALLPDSGLVAAAHVAVPITMALLGAPGAHVDDIRIVASHPVALAQCSRLLARLGVPTEDASTTAAAAAALARSGAHDRAVLASAHAAALYGLAVLDADAGDEPAAVTIFAVLVAPARD